MIRNTITYIPLSSGWVTYLIPINIHAPLFFAHLACAKDKESMFVQYECQKIKAKGGVGVKKTCQAYFKELVAVI